MKKLFNNIVRYVRKSVRKIQLTVHALILRYRAKFALRQHQPVRYLTLSIRSAWAGLKARH